MLTITADENKLLGMNHCEVGMRICRKWRLPPFLQKAVLRHHSPLINDDFSSSGGLIFISHFVGTSDLTGDIIAGMLPPEILTRLNLTASQINKAQRLYRREANSD